MYLDQWLSSGVDALIMPSTPWVGYKPWTWVKSNAYVGYTSIWNLLGYAALAMPITISSREKDIPDQEWLDHVPRNPGDEFNKQQCMKSPLHGGKIANIEIDDIDLVEGMPVGIQVVGGRYGEENCVAVAKAINQAMQKTVDF